jgi:hypothetical protein
MRYPAVTVVPLVGILLVPGLAAAQAAGLRVETIRDRIPATHLVTTVDLTLQPLQPLYLTFTARDRRIEQEAFHGLPQLSESLQGARAEAALLIGWRSAVTMAAGLNRASSGETDAEYLVRAQHALPLDALTTTFLVEAARSRDVSVGTAVAEGIAYDRLGAGVDVQAGRRISGAGRVADDRYNDGNRKRMAYGYGMFRLLDAPGLSVGYAYSWADSDRDNWQATSSEFDPASRTYRYEYFYYPYFTPIQERGHAALASAELSPWAGASLTASANVPVASRGSFRTVPDYGVTAQPPAYGYHTVTGVLPVQAGVRLRAPLGSRATGTLNYAYFSKPYYSYHAGGAGLQFTF